MPAWPIPDDAVREAVLQMLQDGSWGRYHGPHCDALRAALADFHRTEHVILCSSGTAAVELALRAVRVQPSDEVVLAAYDYKANFVNVLTLQATPVLVDTLPGLPILDPAQLKAAITDKTRAILCSHLHGSFARMAEIKAIATARQIAVIEDACQAPGAILNNEVVGGIGDVGVLSFGGSKLLTAGRGGAVLTRDATLAQRIRLYTQRGNDAYPLSEMQAAVLLPQLKQLATRNAARLQAVRQLIEQLPANGPLTPALDPDPRTENDNRPSYYKVALRYCAATAGENRQEFSERMRQAGIRIAPAFAALHKIHGRRRFRSVGVLEHASALHDQLMVLDHPVLLEPPSGLAALLSQR